MTKLVSVMGLLSYITSLSNDYVIRAQCEVGVPTVYSTRKMAQYNVKGHSIIRSQLLLPFQITISIYIAQLDSRGFDG